MVYRALQSPWGWLAVVGDGQTVAHVVLACRTRADLDRRVRSLCPKARSAGGGFEDLCRQFARYVKGQPVQLDVPTDLGGLSPFQQRVLEVCRTIPWGSVRTYRQVAEQAGSPGASRAVGGALARNPVPLVVPCHRVVRSDGRLGGFSATGGVGLKRRLLTHEHCRFREDRVAQCG